jgi:hypothetical protein
LTVTFVACCSAFPLVIFFEKNTTIGMPTPYCSPSPASSDLRWTGLPGGGFGLDEVLAALEVVLAEPLPGWLAEPAAVGLLDEQAVSASASATSAPSSVAARVDRD